MPTHETLTRTAVLICFAVGLAPAVARAEAHTVKFLRNGQQTMTIAPDQPAQLRVVNPSAHRFRCTHLTEGLQVVVTPPTGVDVTLQVEREGRTPGTRIDHGGPGAAETYAGHPPLGATTFHIRATAGRGEVVVAWTWDPTCRDRPRR